MDVATRYIDDLLIIDLFGEFPRAGAEDIEILRSSLEGALKDHQGPVIINIRDAEWMNSTNLGFINSAMEYFNIPSSSWSFVSRSERITRLILASNCLYPRYWCYSSEEDALRNTPHVDRATIWTYIVTGLLVSGIAIVLVIGMLLRILSWPFVRYWKLAR